MLGHGGFAQFSRRIEGEESDGTPSVLSGEEELAAGVNRNVATSAIGAGHTGEFLELATGNLISDGTRSALPTTHGVKNFSIGMKSQKAGRANRGSQLGGGELPVVRVEGGVVNAFGSASTRAEENIDGFGRERAEMKECKQ